MIYEMGLESQLVGVIECHSDKPKVVRSILKVPITQAGNRPNCIIKTRKKHIIDDALLNRSRYYFYKMFCNKDTSHVARSIYTKRARINALIPRNLDDIYQNAITIAKAFDKEERAYELQN
jgi:iron complex transport system substrate-binding protein